MKLPRKIHGGPGGLKCPCCGGPRKAAKFRAVRWRRPDGRREAQEQVRELSQEKGCAPQEDRR